jgi:hypothetical protein
MFGVKSSRFVCSILSHIKVIDGREVTQEEIEESQTTYFKKKTFYNMKTKTWHRYATTIIKEGNKHRNLKIKIFLEQIALVSRAVRDLEGLLESKLKKEGEKIQLPFDPETKLHEWKQMIEARHTEIGNLESKYKEFKKIATEVARQEIQYLELIFSHTETSLG